MLLIPCGNWYNIAQTWAGPDLRRWVKPPGSVFSSLHMHILIWGWILDRLLGFRAISAPSRIEITCKAFTINIENCLTSCTVWFNGMSDEWHMVVCRLKISWRPLSKPGETSLVSYLKNSCALPWVHIIAEADWGELEVLMLSY